MFAPIEKKYITLFNWSSFCNKIRHIQLKKITFQVLKQMRIFHDNTRSIEAIIMSLQNNLKLNYG